jgi:hypothetical protein
MAVSRPHVVCSWSGGIDSTALIAQLLRAGHPVTAVALNIYGGAFARREAQARERLYPVLARMGSVTYRTGAADWIWAFSPDGVEIPRRNRHVIDHLVMVSALPHGHRDIGMGEYIGADTWVVRDHVAGADADTRALAAYVYGEYGLDWRLWTLSDFGEARYKYERVAMGIRAGVDMGLTTNCLTDSEEHCGRCYKCIERAVAFRILSVEDQTVYLSDPRKHPAWLAYWGQMMNGGGRAELPVGAFEDCPPLPRRA